MLCTISCLIVFLIEIVKHCTNFKVYNITTILLFTLSVWPWKCISNNVQAIGLWMLMG